MKMFNIDTDVKAALAERVIRTLKERIYKVFTKNGNYKWVSILKQVTANYNASVNSTLTISPN